MSKMVLLVGGGHASLPVLLQARAFGRLGATVTLVSPDPYWYYSGMAAEVLSGYYGLNDFRVDVRGLAEKYGVEFIHDEVVSLLPDHRKMITATGRTLAYEFAAFTLGARPLDYEGEVPADGTFTLHPSRNVIEIRNEVETLLELETERAVCVVVAGGGAAGVEAALNLAALFSQRLPAKGWKITLVEAKSRVLPGYPKKASLLAGRSLAAAGVQLLTGREIQHIQSGRVVLEKGEMLDFDLAVVALGNRVLDLFNQAGLLTDESGALLVERTLQVRDYPEIFAAGDCARLWGLGLPHSGEHARQQGKLLARNLLAVLQGKPLKTYPQQRAVSSLLSLGPRAALWIRGGRVRHGKWVAACKHWRNRQYLRPYRVPAPPAGRIDGKA